jgi:NitT/TauT family transport system substrate-binding protein
MRRSLVLTTLVAGLVAAACGSSTSSQPAATTAAASSSSAAATTAAATTAAPTTAAATTAAPTTAKASTEPVTLRLGYFPNVTHAPAIVGIEQGLFAKELGSNVTLKTALFNAGPEAVEALNADSIDATFIGPNPAINLWAKSKGQAIKIVAGSTSAGASLVVKPEINSAADLKGKKVASPQLGGTQDVALRSWLLAAGLKTDKSGGGDVAVVPQANADTLAAFKTGDIDGAWVPEPWATRLVQEGGGKVLVDEKTLWPSGKFVTTHLIVAQKFLKDHPDTVEKLIAGLADSIESITKDPAAAQKSTNEGINKATGKPLADKVIAASWANLEFTLDPISSSLKKSAADAQAVGLLDAVDLKGIYDLTYLNKVLSAKGQPSVSDA